MKALVTIIDDDGKVLTANKLFFPNPVIEHIELADIYTFEIRCAKFVKPKILGTQTDNLIIDEFVGDPEFEKHLKEREDG